MIRIFERVNMNDCPAELEQAWPALWSKHM